MGTKDRVVFYRIAKEYDILTGVYNGNDILSDVEDKVRRAYHPMPWEDPKLKGVTIKNWTYFAFVDLDQMFSWICVRDDVFEKLESEKYCVWQIDVTDFEHDKGDTQALFDVSAIKRAKDFASMPKKITFTEIRQTVGDAHIAKFFNRMKS